MLREFSPDLMPGEIRVTRTLPRNEPGEREAA
jgi:hypothetical protein